MLGTMPKPPKKPNKTSGSSAREPKHPNVVLVRLLDPDVAGLRSYMESLKVPPERPAVLLVALREFLAREGHYPPKS